MKLQLDKQDGPNLPLQDGWKVLDVPDGTNLHPGEILSIAESATKAEHVAVQARRHVIEPDGTYRLCCLVIPAQPGARIIPADEKLLNLIDKAKGGAAASALIAGGRR